jgi:hypothetical protein
LDVLTHELLDELVKPGPRLPWIKRWLIGEIWTPARYESLSRAEYLTSGEGKVNRFEELISSSAGRIYDELLSSQGTSNIGIYKSLIDALSGNTAIVVFDGLSLREIPIILKLSAQSGFTVKAVDCSIATVPSNTNDFIEREFQCGRIAPAQLPSRKELKNKGIAAFYSSDITCPVNVPGNISGNATGKKSPILVWSSFPDNKYTDSDAKFENHFAHIHELFETAWINTVQQLKGRKTVIITSDHGYIYFGTGTDAQRTTTELRDLNGYFGNDRYALLSDKPNLPESDDLIVDDHRGVAVIKGRVRTRSTGDGAVKLYKHGGLSLMEMLTPWVVLE